MKLRLPDVTVVIVDTVNYAKARFAIEKTLEQIEPAEVLWFTDIDPDYLRHEIRVHPIQIRSKEEYSRFLVKELAKSVHTSHILIIQADGYVLDANAWKDEYLRYDYIGAPWLYQDERNVGNGGFSLRSTKLHNILATDPYIEIYHPEDECICRLYRSYLEKMYGIRFAPEKLAHKFSFELHPPEESTFGFHQEFNLRYRPHVVLQRSGAMGDVLMMEPVMEYFYKRNHQVILDCPVDIYQLFRNHYFPVMHSWNLKISSQTRVINMNMAYEVKPKQLALKSYYENAGITDGEIRNPKIVVDIHNKKLLDRYIVFHLDDTAMSHRNVHGVAWTVIETLIKEKGYTAIQIGNGPHRIGTKLNAASLNMLMYIIAGADHFIGIDSGPAQIAVALGVHSILFFGSVNPTYRYADLSNIDVIQNPCEFAGCYHEVVSTTGQECRFDKIKPPCITHDTNKVAELIYSKI